MGQRHQGQNHPEYHRESPRFIARLTAFLFLVTLIAGIVAEAFISDRQIVRGDAAATAVRILANPARFQLGFAVYMMEMSTQIAAAVFLYLLLRPVRRDIALTAMVLELTGCTIKAFSRVFYLLPIFILNSPRSLTAFPENQRQALAMLSLAMNDRGAGTALVFFGLSTVLSGYLMFRSGFLPRVLGAASVIAGLGWMTFLYPPLGNESFIYVAGFAVLVLLALTLWLLAFGVDDRKWNELSAAELQSRLS